MQVVNTEDLDLYLDQIGRNAKQAAQELSQLDSGVKNQVLETIAQALIEATPEIVAANQKDIDLAYQAQLSNAAIDRLSLDREGIQKMALGVRSIISLADPVGRIIRQWDRPNGLRISKTAIPIGVIAIIYESRPNVTVDAATLCFKSGNAIILKGGSEAFYSNQVLTEIIQRCLKKFKIALGAVQYLATKNRQVVDKLLTLSQYIHVVIPRGGASLNKKVAEISKIPVIKHYDGVCHVYIESDADLEMARAIVINAKTQRPGVCNAMECLLVHKDLLHSFLPSLIQDLKNKNVAIRADEDVYRSIPGLEKAQSQDWSKEYLDLILNVKVVQNIEAAIQHINQYGSGHTDSIVTQDDEKAKKFLMQVDSATVLHNASTRFSDGFEFGFGAEMGISTDRLHARGPMGLEELTTYKYVIHGNGQIRS